MLDFLYWQDIIQIQTFKFVSSLSPQHITQCSLLNTISHTRCQLIKIRHEYGLVIIIFVIHKMAFWALGKVKSVASAINVKQVGSKLKNYYTQPKKVEEQCSPVISKEVQSLSEQQLMERQLAGYRKLVELEQLILAEEQSKQMKKIEETQQYLAKLQSEMLEESKENKKKHAMNKLIEEVESGNMDLKVIMQENMMLREELSRKKMHHEISEWIISPFLD